MLGKLAVSKKGEHKFDGIRFNLRKLNERKVREEYQIEITNRFAALTPLVSCTLFYKNVMNWLGVTNMY
jgi:hypothetical protein